VVLLDVSLYFYADFAGHFLEVLGETLGFCVGVVSGLDARLFRDAESLGVGEVTSLGR